MSATRLSANLRTRNAAREGISRLVEAAVERWRAYPTDERFHVSRFPAYLCRSALMQVAGAQEMDYETLLVLSGHATAFAYHPQRYHVMYSTPDSPEEVDQRIARASGLSWVQLGQAESTEQAWDTVRASIVEGKALQGSWIDDIIICGFRDARAPEGREVFVVGGWDEPAWWPWDRFDKWAAEFGRMSHVGERVPVAAKRAVAHEAVETMVRCADHDGRAGVQFLQHAAYGLAGLKVFASDIADLSRSADDWHPGWHGGHCVYRQVAGRAVAARFLRGAATILNGLTRAHLRAASEAYLAAAAQWEVWGAHLGMESGRSDAEDLRMLWVQPANRRAGSKAALRALAHEAEAIQQLRLTLRKLGG